MADEIRATPQRNPQLGALARLLKNVDEFGRRPFGYDNPPVALLSDLMGVPAVQRTLERASYGEPLTVGRGWATRMRPDTEEAAFALAGGAGPLARVAKATRDLPVGMVIKPKGGNWLSGSVERAVEPMKQTVLNETGLQNLAERAGVDVSESVRARQLPEAALNKWLDQKLSKYIRNEMATPEDPIRALAERGITHAEVAPLDTYLGDTMARRRTSAGFPAGGLGQSDAAQRWEAASDYALHNAPAGARLDISSPPGAQERMLSENPWMAKVPPETMTYGAYSDARHGLGFEHLTDELRNAINPESGLPANLQWKYGDLNKVTVPQAVQRVHDINTWRAAQKAEADLQRAMNPATFTHKEYPETGMRWVELRKPEDTGRKIERTVTHDPEGDIDDLMDRGFGRFVEDLDPEDLPTITHQIDESVKTLEDALKYEGETMGHCVGGYCPDVVEGRSRIYSLRDRKGQPHVTIEVGAPRNLDEQQIPDRYVDEALDMLGGEHPGLDPDEVNNLARELFSIENPAVSDIIQIKGKANRAPNAEYLPAVQDFIRSGNWGRVGDLQNAGLIDARAAGKPLPGRPAFMTPEEFEAWKAETKDAGGSVEGFATGGAVETGTAGIVQMNPAKIQSLIDSLHEENYNA